MSGRKKLVLAVIDSLRPEMLDSAIATGRAPALAALVERGTYVRDCVSSFPSVTPVAAGNIVTGEGPDGHHVPGMNWYQRGQRRYVEYGSSFQAMRAFGIVRSLYDTVYNLNLAHLNRSCKTVFEQLDEVGVRTACTTYLIYRGRTRHRPDDQGTYSWLAQVAQFRHAVWGPSELFYADLFDSRKTGCRSALGLPGQRDQHAACVGVQIVEHDLVDFLLLSLPDTDAHSHRHGPDAQVTAIAGADRALERMIDAAGGVEPFLDRYAVIVMSDHAQTAVESRIDLGRALDGWRLLTPAGDSREGAQIAVCPSQRSAMIYVLGDRPQAPVPALLLRDLERIEGIDLIAFMDGGEAVVKTSRGELRFARGGGVVDQRGGRWSVDGELAALDLSLDDARVSSRDYPDALGRLWSALACPTAGDVVLSAMPGYEFADWGGIAHVGGGSHGSLHRGDSLGVLILCGVDPPAREIGQWTIADVTPTILEHFAVAS